MLKNQELLEPVTYYKKAENLLQENIDSYFNELVKKSQMNVEEHKKTVKLYDEESELVSGISKELHKYKIFRTLLIFSVFIGIVLLFFGIKNSENLALCLSLNLSGVALIIISLSLIFSKINKSVLGLKKQLQDHSAIAQKILDQANAQMSSLNNLFSDDDTFILFEKTLPQFQFNRFYSRKDEIELIKHYDYKNILSETCSIINSISGKFCNNPFIYFRYKKQLWGSETYSGSITISWRESYRDEDGNTHYETKTQVLTASVVKPKPYYKLLTALGFGNQTAPDLTFSRNPKHSEKLSEKQLEREVRSGAKDLSEIARDATEKGSSFQEMANTEFDVLFGAINRDNEVQFRTMFSPLAQTNTVDLLTNKDGYGDDFKFYKLKRYNVIESEHAQTWTMNTSAKYYRSYSLSDAERRFKERNTQFFKSVYFDFAPFMSIPAYMEEPSFAMEELEEYDTNYTECEYESLANTFGESQFAPQFAATESILKSSFLRKEGNSDIVNIKAHSFTTSENIDYITKLGGDGHLHQIPVHWISYEPIENSVNISISEDSDSKNKYCATPYINGEFAYLHGLLAKIQK